MILPVKENHATFRKKNTRENLQDLGFEREEKKKGEEEGGRKESGKEEGKKKEAGNLDKMCVTFVTLQTANTADI